MIECECKSFQRKAQKIVKDHDPGWEGRRKCGRKRRNTPGASLSFAKILRHEKFAAEIALKAADAMPTKLMTKQNIYKHTCAVFEVPILKSIEKGVI